MNLCCYGREMSVIISLYLCFLQREVLQFCLCSNTFFKVVLEVLYKYFFPTQINILHQSCLCLFLFVFGCLSYFVFQSIICSWLHCEPWQDKQHLFACVLNVAIKLS